MKKAISFIMATLFITAMFGGLVMTLSSCSLFSKGTTYYVSSSEGKDINSGKSSRSPWKSFEKFKTLTLQPGDKVLLKRGDVWHERLVISGAGEEDAWIYVGSFGDEKDEKPIISLNQDKDDICILIQDIVNDSEKKYRQPISYIHIDGLDIRNSYLGIYFRFVITYDNKGFKVTNCNFKNIYSDDVFNEQLKDIDSYLAWSASSKGNLPTFDTSLKYKETGGGKSEYIWPDAILVCGKGIYDKTIASEFEVANCVFENCTGGFHSSLPNLDSSKMSAVRKIRMTDCVGTGTYNGMFRFEHVDGGWDGTENSEWGIIKNVRHLGSNHLKAGVTGPTAAYAAVCKNILISECELSYCYAHGGGDGCGLDYETYVFDMTIRDTVFHNNDGEAFLQLKPAEGLPEYENTVIERTLFYNNLKNPYFTAEQNYDIMTGTLSKTVFFRNLYIYMPQYNPAKPNYKTEFFGPLGQNAVKTNNVTKYLESYRNRFAFNNNSNTESWTAGEGIADLKVENGLLSFTLTKEKGYIVSDMPINLFAYDNAVLQLKNTTAAKVGFAYRWCNDDNYYKGDEVQINDESQTIYAPVSGKYTTGYARSMLLEFSGKPGDKVFIDSIEFTSSFDFSTEAKDELIKLSVDGKARPFFSDKASKDGFDIKGLPAGTEVVKIEQYDYNTVYIYLNKPVKKETTLIITVNSDQFIPYFKDMLDNLDFGNRTPEKEAELFGYSTVQTYVKNGKASASVEIK